VAGSVAVSLVLLLPPADAAPPDRIQWRAPAECPDDAAVEERIAAILGPVATADVRASADVTADFDGFAVDVVTFIDGAEQRRRLEAPRCPVLVDAVAVVVAVALDPVAVSQGPVVAAPRLPEAPVIASTPDPMSARADRTSSSPPRSEKPRSRRRWTFGSRIAGGYGVGTAPSGTGLVVLALFAETGLARLELEGRYWAPRTIDRDDFGARVQLGTVGVAACLQWGGAIVSAPVCAGLEAGALRAAPFGLTSPRTLNLPWVAPLVRAALRVRVHARVGLWLAAEGAVLVVRPLLQQNFAAPQPLWDGLPVSARVMLGIETRWTL